MEVKQSAAAGTLESSDAYVQVEPHDGDLRIEIESVVYNQFGEEIEKMVREVLAEFQVNNAIIRLNDRGAVECAIRARVETALKRAGGVK